MIQIYEVEDGPCLVMPDGSSATYLRSSDVVDMRIPHLQGYRITRECLDTVEGIEQIIGQEMGRDVSVLLKRAKQYLLSTQALDFPWPRQGQVLLIDPEKPWRMSLSQFSYDFRSQILPISLLDGEIPNETLYEMMAELPDPKTCREDYIRKMVPQVRVPAKVSDGPPEPASPSPPSVEFRKMPKGSSAYWVATKVD